MQEGYCDVMIMAAAGLQRLEMDEYISELIDPEVMIPACSQGAIAIEIRENDPLIEDLLSKINDKNTFIATSAERAFLKTLEEWFKEFFEKEVPANPLKAEYLIPTFIGELLSEGKMSVKVLRTNDTWYGMTYKEDVAAVKESFSKMLEDGTYKGDLFSDL